MKKIILVALVTAAITSQAQVFHDRIGFDLESIADIDIGWMKTYKNTTPAKGLQLANRTYSAKQIGNSQQFMEWMQQSYFPRGCIGNVANYQNHIPKFSGTNSKLGNAINMHRSALPHMYGAFSTIYMFLKKDAQGKFAPLHGYAEFWHIGVNQVEFFTNPVSFISSAEEFYFVLPNFKDNAAGYEADDKAASNLKGFNNHKNFARFKHFYIPPKTVEDNSWYVVIMTKEKELPFEKVTIGEFFTQVEKQLPVWQNVDPAPAERYAVAQKNLVRLKEKYKSKWNDIAELSERGHQMSLYTFINATEGYDDMFDNKDRTSFPILKVKRAARELCKTDQPQWVVIRWTMGMSSRAFNLHMHESITNNFNFEYLYNYLFDPEKVKGQTYQPLRSPTYKEAVVVADASEASKKNAADKNTFFFEDFSTTTVGKKPIGWNAKLKSDGSTSTVAKPDGLGGNWVELLGHNIDATLLKKPLPQNFTLSYDIVATKDFAWGSKGLTMLLAKETKPGNAESFISLRLRPGFDGRDGEVTLETKFPSPPGYSNDTKWYKATGFSNNKKFNRITITVKKIDEKLQVFIDNTKVAEYEKAIPSAHLFNALSFDAGGNSAETDKYFISNIKITKD